MGARLDHIATGWLRRRVVASHVLVGMIASSSASAEDRLSVKPSLTVEEVRDDNLFLTTSTRVTDSIFRVSPSLEATFRSPRVEAGWRYSFDAERYMNHPELNANAARQTAGTTWRFVASERLTIGTDASYFRTHTPQELNLTTALASARANAERWELAPSVTYKMSPQNQATVAYSYTRDFTRYPLATAVLSETDSGRFAFKRQVTAADAAIVEYQARRFTFGSDRSDLSHVVSAGWERRISSRTDVTLQVGPRMAAGRFAPEAALSLKQRRDRGDIAVEYARSESASIGQTGAVGYQRLALDLAARPGNGFEVRVTDAVVRNLSPVDGLDALVYAVDINVTKSIGPWLAISSGFHGVVQKGTVAFVDGTIPHSAIMLRLVAARQLTTGPQPDRQP